MLLLPLDHYLPSARVHILSLLSNNAISVAQTNFPLLSDPLATSDQASRARLSTSAVASLGTLGLEASLESNGLGILSIIVKLHKGIVDLIDNFDIIFILAVVVVIVGNPVEVQVLSRLLAVRVVERRLRATAPLVLLATLVVSKRTAERASLPVSVVHLIRSKLVYLLGYLIGSFCGGGRAIGHLVSVLLQTDVLGPWLQAIDLSVIVAQADVTANS